MKYVIHTYEDRTGVAPADAQWMACFGEYDLGAVIGTGATEVDAISDLVLNHDLEAAT